MQRSLMTKQHSKQFLLIRNRDVAIRHNIEAYLMMSCQINNIKFTQVWSNNLDLESQTKTKVLFHKTKYSFLKRNFVSRNKILFQETKILFQETKILFQETKFCFRKAMLFLLKLDETKCYSKRLSDRCNDLWWLSSTLNNFCWFEIATLQYVITSRHIWWWHVK